MKNNFSTCDICDAHEARLLTNDLRVLPPVFHSYGARQHFSGSVVTLKAYEDNSLIKSTLDTAGAGRVLVIDGGGSVARAVVGGNIATAAARNGWAGVLVWGAVRDAAELAAAETGVLALGLCPARSTKRQQGVLDVPVQIAGVTVNPGDCLYADEDGVLISSIALSA
jgi:regulator of ribonuclease activity A